MKIIEYIEERGMDFCVLCGYEFEPVEGTVTRGGRGYYLVCTEGHDILVCLSCYEAHENHQIECPASSREGGQDEKVGNN